MHEAVATCGQLRFGPRDWSTGRVLEDVGVTLRAVVTEGGSMAWSSWRVILGVRDAQRDGA